jgi:hypothetical protein
VAANELSTGGYITQGNKQRAGRNKRYEGMEQAGKQAGREQAALQRARGKKQAASKWGTSNRLQAKGKYCNLGGNQWDNARQSKQHGPVNLFTGSD